VPAVRARTRLPCVLVVDNGGADCELKHPQVAFFPLPSNVTSNHQPLDAGIIAALKGPYKARLLGLVVGDFEQSRLAEIGTAGTSRPPLHHVGSRSSVPAAHGAGFVLTSGASDGAATVGARETAVSVQGP